MQAALVPIGYPGILDMEGLRLNMYTMPGFINALITIGNMILVICLFKEVYKGNSNLESSDTGKIPEYIFF